VLATVARVHSSEPPVTIKVRDDGPLKVTGPVRIVDAEGRAWDVDAERPVALCRCGRSRTKPFCDRSHRDAGFASRERA
jgi:CDGSH iron-sulfur domain-containing protein 3